MKIIKNTDVIQITCTNCNSVLEVERADVEYTPVFGHGTHIDVTCPVCDMDFPVGDKIPEKWHRKFQQEHAKDEE